MGNIFYSSHLAHAEEERRKMRNGMAADEFNDGKKCETVSECTTDIEQTKATAREFRAEDSAGQGCYGVKKFFEFSSRSDYYKSCRNSWRHPEYIHVTDFCMDHLPPQYRTECMLAMVKAQIKLTVLLKVSKISQERAEYFPGTGKNALLWGSGRVVKVMEFPNAWDKDVAPECLCEECQTSRKPLKSYGNIVVQTTAHVVYNLEEARNTVCYFDFDSESTCLSSCPALRSGLKVWSNAKYDISEVTFVTHDLEWARCLKETVKTYNRLCDDIKREYGVGVCDGISEECQLGNIFLLYRRYEEVVEKWCELMGRLKNTTIAEAEQRLEEYKHKNKIQPEDKLSDYGQFLEDMVHDSDQWRQRLTDMSDMYKEGGRSMANICDLQEHYQSYVGQYGVQWMMNKCGKHFDGLENMNRRLAAYTGDQSDSVGESLHYNPSHPLTVIVSHPHGLRKQISIGQVTTRNCEVENSESYIYNGPTCPGSSGAPVFILGRTCKFRDKLTYPHSRSVQNENGTDGCGICHVYRDDHLAWEDVLETEGLGPQDVEVRKQKERLQTDKVKVCTGVTDQKTSDDILESPGVTEPLNSPERSQPPLPAQRLSDLGGQCSEDAENMYMGLSEFKIGTSAICECSQSPQNTEHILQNCTLLSALRETYWPQPTDLNIKLYGALPELQKTVDFIKRTNLQI